MGHNIIVIGVGGGADQTLKRLKQTNIQHIDYLTINSYSAAFPDINLGMFYSGHFIYEWPHIETWIELTIRAENDIREMILKKSPSCVIIVAGFGGFTGTGSAPVVAHIVKSLNLFSVGIITTPFRWEGKERKKRALSNISHMKKYIDSLFVIDSDSVLENIPDSYAPNFVDMFNLLDKRLCDIVKEFFSISFNNVIHWTLESLIYHIPKRSFAFYETETASNIQEVENSINNIKYEFVKNGINHESIKFMITNIHVSSLSAIKMNHIQKITSAINDSFHMSMHDLGIGITIDDKVGDKIRIAILIFTIALN